MLANQAPNNQFEDIKGYAIGQAVHLEDGPVPVDDNAIIASHNEAEDMRGVHTSDRVEDT